MATLTNPKSGAQIIVPDGVADSYISRGWAAPGAPTPAEALPPAPKTLRKRRAGARKKTDIRAAIDAAETVTETVTDPETAQ